uniref:Large ribosomal subunit protein bL12c n=1 Tax=Pterocladia lucida TaxID=31408 RepID=A0A6M3WX07_PTELU|nr:ribosomal protein L12 [Pterocladia lucida]
MSNKIENIIDNLKTLTLLEAAELVKQIEDTFDVDASSSQLSNMVAIPASGDISDMQSIEEKTEFDVFLDEVPTPNKIAILKVVRSLTDLGLKEAKNLVESAPKSVKEGASKEEAEDIKLKLEEAGAKVSIK